MPEPQDLRPRETVYDPQFLGWLQDKGLLEVVEQKPAVKGFAPRAPGQVPAPLLSMENVPVNIRQSMKDDFLHFIKGKGYSPLEEPLPTPEEAKARLAASTKELHDIYVQQAGTTIGPMPREEVEKRPIMASTAFATAQRQPTIGRPRPQERVQAYSELQAQKLPQEKSFWGQISDALSLVRKGHFDEAAGIFVEAGVSGLTLGLVGPEELDKVDRLFLKAGISSEQYKTLRQRRAETLQTLGYYPAKAAGSVAFVYSVLPISKVLRFAKGAGLATTTVPALQRLITSAVAGGITGATEIVGEILRGKKFDPQEDLKKIPPHMLWWALFEFGTLGVETAAKIINWNLKYGGKVAGTGKYGGYGAAQGIEFETHYAPGRGPTTKQQFTADELRDIFRRGDPSYQGTGKIPTDAEGGSWERNVYNSLSDARGWREAVRRGWMSPRPIEVPGEPPIVTGTTIRRTRPVPPTVGLGLGGEQRIPMKPDVGQIFRRGGALRDWPAPGILEGAPPLAGAPIPAAPAPGAVPPPEMGPQARPGPSAAPPAGAPPPGTAPPAIRGGPTPRETPAPPREAPPIAEVPPAERPKIKVTPQADGSFTVETVEPPKVTKAAEGPPAKAGAIPEVAPVEAKEQLPRDQPLRDAIDNIRSGQGTPEDVSILAQAPRESERFNRIIEELRPEIDKIKRSELAGEMVKGEKPRGAIQIQQEMVKLRETVETLREEGDPQGFVPNLEAQRRALSKEWEKAKAAEQAAEKGMIPKRKPRPGSFEDMLGKIPEQVREYEKKGKPAETPEEHVRRILKSRAEAMKKRGRVGMPKNAPRIVQDILEVTSGKGIKPILNAKGQVSEEYRSIPKYLKNKDGFGIDDVETMLERGRNYPYGKGATKSLLDDLQNLNSREQTMAGKAPARDSEEWVDMAKEVQAEIEGRSKVAEEAGIKTPEETYSEFIERMAVEADESGLSEDEAWVYAEAKIQAQKAYAEKYRPIMTEGETWPQFLGRMEKDAVAADMFPEDSLVYADRLLKKKVGSSEPSGMFISPRIKETGATKGSSWYSGMKDTKGRALVVIDPSPSFEEDTEIYTREAGQLEYDEKNVREMPEWRLTLQHWLRGDDPNFNDFLGTIKRIFVETDGYGKGVRNNIPYIPPIAMKVAIEKNFKGHKGARMFQLKWLLAHDFAARLFQVPVGNPPFFGTHAFLMGYFQPPHPLAGRTAGGFIRPSTGEMFINPHYMDVRALDDPWSVAGHMKDIVLHEFGHYWDLAHNEKFTTRLVMNGTATNHLMPYLVQIGEKITGKTAYIDKRKTVFISLGPGRGQDVPANIVDLAGNETAKMIAESKEDKGDRKLWEPKAITGKGRKPEPGAGGAAPAGEPGPPSDARARRGPELAYPRGDVEARAPRLEFGARPVGWEPPAPEAPPGEFALTPEEPKAPPFKPTELAQKQGVLPMEAETELFKKKPDDRFIILVRANQTRPPRPKPRPLPEQPRIPDEGTWTAIRTDDGGIYFGTSPNHYELVQKLGIPPERVVGGGFIHNGLYEESPWSEGGRIGRDAREAMGLPREAFAITGKQADRIMPEIRRLTSGRFFPKEWEGNTEQEIQDNRQNLARFVLENYRPEMGPLENYISANKRFFIRGAKARQLERMEDQYPEPEVEPMPEVSAFSPESQPKNKPQPEPEIPGETLKHDLFGSEEIRALNTIRRAGQTYAKSIGATGATEDRIVEVLKSRILTDTPESYSSLADRLGISRKTAQNYFNGGLELMRGDPEMIKLLEGRMKQANLGPVPSAEDLRRMAKMLRKYFSSYRGADKIIDQENDRRIGARMAEIFQQTLDSGKLKKWLDDQPAGVNEYVNQLVQGQLTGDSYADIRSSSLPDDIKQVLVNFRTRADRLSELIVLHGGLTGDTKAAFERNLGKYLTKSYRLYEDKHWDPSEADRAGFKRFLMNEYGLTDAQADEFIEAELAYARNDEGLRPRHRRRTRRVPTENFIRRRELSPEWRKFAGEIERVPWLTLNTITKQATMAYNARFLDWVADYLPDHWVTTFEEAAQRGWQNSRLPEHSYSYGKLAGKWVDPELFQYIKNEVDTNRSDIEEIIQKVITNPFKWTKTIGSYPTHMRNFLGNTMFSVLAQNSIANPLNARWYKRSLDIHLGRSGTERQAWADLIAKGVTETQFYGADIPRIHKDVMRFDPEEWYERLFDSVVKMPIDKLGELYNFEDSFYRVAAYLKMAAPRSDGGLGLSERDAVEEINATLQNYRKLPIAVDILRRWPVLGPFVSFRWNVAKIIANQARTGFEDIKNPARRGRGVARLLRTALMLSLPLILSEISKRTNNVDEEKIKELERWYPEYRRNGTFFYFRDKDGELKVFDFSYLWPTGEFERAAKALAKGDITGLKDALDFFSHPLFDVWSILVRGQDPQWGTKYRTVLDRAKAAAAYLYLPASMPIPNLEGLLKGDIRPGTLTGPQVKAIIDAFNGQPDAYGRVKELPEEFKNFFTGIRTWSVEPEKLLAQAAAIRVGQIRDLQSELTRWVRRNSKAPQWEIENQTRKFKERIEKIGSELGDIKALREELAKAGFQVTRY